MGRQESCKDMTRHPDATAREQSVRESLETLRPKFIESLSSRQRSLIELRDSIDARDAVGHDAKEVEFIAHGLRGSAANYFFPEIAQSAARLEDTIRGVAAPDTNLVLEHINQLLALCRAARSAK